MPIQKKHKIYAALVAAALVAWVIDAMFFGPSESSTPSAAAAATVARPNAESAPAAVPPSARPEAFQEHVTQWLGAQLRAWSEKNPDAIDQVHDMFSTPASWVSQRPVPTPPAPGKVAEDFQREHHLTAVVLGASGGSAVIDGRLLRVGQTVGGCRLTAVSSGCADLVGPDGREFRVLIGPENDKNVK
jgi:hypothetical protein